MEMLEKATKLSRKGNRIKLEFLVCHHQFDNDHCSTHNKTRHSALISQHKAIPHKVVNAQKNPFEAAKQAYVKTEKSHMLICSTSSSIKTVAMEDSEKANDRTQEVDIERYENSSQTATPKMDSEVTEQPICDIGVKFIQMAANNADLS